MKSIGIIVARFQIHKLHKGHESLIESVLEKHDRVIIFLGVAPVYSRKNPLSFEIRKNMVLSKYPSVEILPLKDNPSNDDWVSVFEKKIKDLNKDVILYGSRDSFLGTYLKHGGKYPYVELKQTDLTNATDVRNNIGIIDDEIFRAGVIFAQHNNNYPTTFPTVDIITTRLNSEKEIEILLGQKHIEVDSELWRLPGGFIDTTDETGRIAASRELKEETCLEIDPKLFKFVEQIKILDWRYRGTENGIMTSLYTVETNQEAKAGDDLAKVKWFKLSEVLNHVRPIHKICIETYLEQIKNK